MATITSPFAFTVRAAAREPVAQMLSRARERQRFLALTILDAPSPAGDEGEVLFFARIFSRGADQSFAELSRFVKEDGAWRYASGVLLQRPELPEDPTMLDRGTFLALGARLRS